MTRPVILRLAAATAVAAVAVPSAAQAVRSSASTATVPAATGRVVTLEDIAYTPKKLTIMRGQTVTWIWKDGAIPHDVNATGFKSSTIKNSGIYKVKFTKRGTFAYHCTIHPSMTAKVVVR